MSNKVIYPYSSETTQLEPKTAQMTPAKQLCLSPQNAAKIKQAMQLIQDVIQQGDQAPGGNENPCNQARGDLFIAFDSLKEALTK